MSDIRLTFDERSVRIRPNAEASGTVRKERRKLLAWHGDEADRSEEKYYTFGQVDLNVKLTCTLIQHVEKETQFAGQTKLLGAGMFNKFHTQRFCEIQYLAE